MREITEKDALSRLMAQCSKAECCTHDIMEKMRRWGLAADAQERVTACLKEHKFIDEERFARSFALDKVRYNKWGPRKVEQALWAKRVDEETRRKALAEVSGGEYLRVLRQLLDSRRKSLRAADTYELNRKLARFALGRGFTMDMIRQCLDGDCGMETDDEDQYLE